MAKIALFTLLMLSLCHCATQTIFVEPGDDLTAGGPEFQWPVYGAALTQKFRPRKKPPYRRRHQGIDLAAAKNTPIYAIDHGIVSYAGHGLTGYGRLVVIQHLNKEIKSYYAHLSRYKVEKGDVVRKGDLIGLMGRSGRATGVHLHFEIRKNKVALNPLDVLPSAAAVSARQANPQP